VKPPCHNDFSLVVDGGRGIIQPEDGETMVRQRFSMPGLLADEVERSLALGVYNGGFPTNPVEQPLSGSKGNARQMCELRGVRADQAC
jgi:hypothetical protein